MRYGLLLAGLLVLAVGALLPAPESLGQQGWVALALLVTMALWWFTEALPVAATAMLPVVVLPLTGASKLGDVTASYMAPVIFLVLGGALLALAMERAGLHRRLAVAVVSRSSSAPRALVFAFMIATAFVSMWVSNTATTLIMMPIALAVLVAVLPVERNAWSAAQRTFAACLVLGVAYSASIGGLGTLVGSPTNAIATALIERTLGVHIGFVEWLAFGLPIVLLTIPLAWLLLTRVSHRFALGPFDRDAVLTAIGPSGSLTRPERRLLPILAFAVIAWIGMPLLRSLPGLGALDDAIVAVIAALALFVVPAGDGRTLLEWRDAVRAPWDVLLLFGGGLALADAITTTGLGNWIGNQMIGLDAWHAVAVMVAVVIVVVLVTEFASNVAAASSFVPVVAGLASVMSLDPLVLVIPAAIAASWGFMMPAGTPPNAIAFATGHLRIREMVRAGFLVDLLGLVAIPAAAGFALWIL
jgi:solute carrier family 13 (sodium-dependent dicarboxylate transporter), member 2/3/5